MIKDDDKKTLLALARDIIYKRIPDTSNLTDELKKPCGVFVTLKYNNKLRGCIGFIDAIMPLYKGVMQCAWDAAYKDTRFLPVREDELDGLKIEISILSPLVRLDYTLAADLLEKLEIRLGVVIKKGAHKAVFLPQVWESFSTKDDFLDELCKKAGLIQDIWREGDLEVFTFTVEKISD